MLNKLKITYIFCLFLKIFYVDNVFLGKISQQFCWNVTLVKYNMRVWAREAPTMSIFIANCIFVGTKNRESNALHQSESFLAQQEIYLLILSTIKPFIYYKTVKYELRVLYRLQLQVVQ